MDAGTLNTGGDAELLRLAALMRDSFSREQEQYREAVQARASGASLRSVTMIEDAASPHADEAERYAAAMLAFQSEGLDGLIAKADAVVWALGSPREILDCKSLPLSERLLYAIVRDLRRLKESHAISPNATD